MAKIQFKKKLVFCNEEIIIHKMNCKKDSSVFSTYYNVII